MRCRIKKGGLSSDDVHLGQLALVGLMGMLGLWCVATTYGEEIQLSVSPATPPATDSSVSVGVGTGGFGSAVDTSTISGTLQLELLPSAVDPETARITQMHLVVGAVSTTRPSVSEPPAGETRPESPYVQKGVRGWERFLLDEGERRRPEACARRFPWCS